MIPTGDTNLKGIMYIESDYKDAMNFALNYPPDFDLVNYDEELDLYRVSVFDAGWYSLSLHGFFVRSCLKWKGKKLWSEENNEKITS